MRLSRTMGIEMGHWTELKRLAGSTFSSSLHFAIATVNPDGTPHVTPIGSLMLSMPSEGYFFEVFADRLCANLDRSSPVSVAGVISSSSLWLRALIAGRFGSSPAHRLIGVAGVRRTLTEAERKRWHERIRFFRLLKGHELLWGNLGTVRELHFHALEPVRLRVMPCQFHDVTELDLRMQATPSRPAASGRRWASSQSERKGDVG